LIHVRQSNAIGNGFIMKKTIAISIDENAFSLISESIFIHQWRDLCEACSWGTAFQSPDYVKAWYETFRERFNPVVLSMADSNGQLLGLFTLAISRSNGQLVYAGDIYAEYQVWLARKDANDAFVSEVLDLLREKWPRKVLVLKYLPPRTDLGPIEKSNWLKNICFFRPSSRPFIGLDAQQRVDQSLKSKQVKLNRLKRIGVVSFIEIKRDEFAEIFEHAWPLYEFRMIKQYGSSPFLRDADLKRLWVAVARHSDALHMSVLKVDETIVAWFLGLQGHGYLHLLSMGYSPFYSRHSPAMLHMLLLAKRLIQEGRVFDLTPGGSKYKDQLATAHEKTYTLYFIPSLRSAIDSEQTRDLAGRAVRRLVRIAVKKPVLSLAAALDRRRGKGVDPENPRPPEPKIRFRLYKLNTADCARHDERLDAIRKNEIADLIRYESTHAQSLRDFVSEAWHFIDQQADVYTLMRNDRLAASCWIVSGEKTASSELANADVPAGTPLLVGFYVHADEDGGEILNMFIEKWRNEITPILKATELNIGIPEIYAFPSIHFSGESASRLPVI
jgi:CelD/BcsL family acetyltransferase involved in cellulose biosynthesis